MIAKLFRDGTVSAGTDSLRNRRSKFGFCLNWIMINSRQPTTTPEPALTMRKSPSHRSGRKYDAACQSARRKSVDEARTTRRPAGRAFVGRHLRQLDALHFAWP